VQSLGYFYDLSLEVMEVGLASGRRWCRQDDGLVIQRKKFRERFSLQRSAKDSRFVAKSIEE